jgi:putative protease
LISSYLASRDSNQGVCTNSCRWQYQVHQTSAAEGELPVKTAYDDKYTPLTTQFFLEESERKGTFYPVDEDENGTYLMNAKDLCVIRYLAEIRAAGVTSFKVEGRSKTVYYAAMIARAYRKAMKDMHDNKPFNPEHLTDIFATSTRGFNEGFLHGDPGPGGQEYDNSHSMYGTYRFSGIVRGYDPLKQRIKLERRNPVKVGLTYELCLPSGNVVLNVNALFDSKERPVREIHGGLHFCWIPYPEDPGEYALVRERIKAGMVMPDEKR